MGSLTRDDIMAADDLHTRIVPVPEWGGDVRLRMLTGEERDRYELSVTDGKSIKRIPNLRAALVALSVVTDDGERMFRDADVPALGRKSAAVLDRLFNAALELNGMSPDAIEEAEKNSDETTSGNSGSD